MASAPGVKKSVNARLRPEALAQLDTLVRRGRFKSRSAAIEEAVAVLYTAEQGNAERKRLAFERAAGALRLGVDGEAWRRAERDRLDWEAQKSES